jgi:hypothetical protein
LRPARAFSPPPRTPSKSAFTWRTTAPGAVRFTSATPLQGAQRLSHIETPIEPLPVKDGALETSIGAQRMETFELQPAAP